MMESETRLQATRAVWTALGIALAFLFLSAGIGSGLQTGHVILGVAMVIAGMGSTSFIWTVGESARADTRAEIANQEKAKRDRLDRVLRDLSDDDLMTLRQRLSDGSIDDDVLYEQMTLSDDGELIPSERRS
ncbi:MAG: hypothetical protein WBC91_06355 [Phototrophicaceae bacterium]